jgi:tripartite-type tricarboxylate transporter receptor subunit TctC
MLNRREALAAVVGAAAASGGLSPARAQAVQKLVHMIVGFPAGGGTDIVARVLAQALHGSYADNIIVEDKPGASARLAVEYVKNAPADGSVMLFTPDFPFTLYPSSFKSLKYDPVNDFIAAAGVSKGMLTLVVGPGVPGTVRTLADFLAWCRVNPGKANLADTSAGGTPHLTGVMLARAAGVVLTPVHYRGGAPAMEDLMSGQVPASINPVAEVLAFAQAGSIRALAVTGAQRSSFLPDVPTMKEQGFDVVVETYSGVFLPAKTPQPVVAALAAAVQAATASKQMTDSLAKFGTAPGYLSTADFSAWIEAQILHWGPVVKASGFVATE